MNPFNSNQLTSLLKCGQKKTASLINKFNLQDHPFPKKDIEFNVSHFLRRPIANMYSIVFEIGLDLKNGHNLQRDLNFLKSLNKELTKAIDKIEKILKEDSIENIEKNEDHLKIISLNMFL
ncbi:hypothetical protein [Reichenbachiella sp. 5M10]|uniref:hypothetical protein n=1 Tax=Reichenbachiella sp. 5M10 TaxID=1889772 RepID=UPI00117B460B|nr:hypothetical protein [Reichenbachiella sp. 5M10]